MTYDFLSTFLKPALEILILWIVFYRIFVFLEGTRAFFVLRGVLYLAFIFLVTKFAGLDNINWILTKIFGISVIALIIIFQSELRQGLARLGQQKLFGTPSKEREAMDVIEHMADALTKLSKRKAGALIAVEREDKLKTCIESGLEIDARISSELLQNIFTPPTPLHDGGVIVRADRIMAAACLFPLSEKDNLNKTMGTRHRAALGMSEQTDAIVLTLSEETRKISIAVKGEFIPVSASKEQLMNLLREILITPKNTERQDDVEVA